MYIQNIESLQQMNEFTGDDNDDDHVGKKKAKLNNEGWLGEAEGSAGFVYVEMKWSPNFHLRNQG